MTYVASVIASNPGNYWRLNEGAGASAALDYGNFPGMLWPDQAVVSGVTFYGLSGFGFGGITADGGALNVAPLPLINRVPPGSTTQNAYTPLPEPGTLEAWYFNEDSTQAVFIGWLAPNAPANQQFWGLNLWDSHVDGSWLTAPGTVTSVSPLGQWHHVAASWSAGSGFVYVDGSQRTPFTYTAPVGGGHVSFRISTTNAGPFSTATGGLVTEVATYRRALTVGDLDTHFNQAELKGQRPHWIGQHQVATGGSSTLDWAYSLGVTHVARSGSGSFSVPTGLRGVKIDLIPPFPAGRTSPGTPVYLWDVGWCTIANVDGMLEEIRPNRDTRVWLPQRMSIATSFTHDLNPGWVMDVSELDPA